MKFEPRILNNVCLTAHPVGCAQDTRNQIAWQKEQNSFEMPKRVLVLGGSTGYGLATRIAAAFGGAADTICVSFEKEPSEKRTGTPGWYNNAAFKVEAEKEGLKAFNINGDAFSHEIKSEVIELITKELEQVDLVVYSLASPVRKDPYTGETYRSVIKPIGQSFKGFTVDIMKGTVKDVTAEPASEEEITPTVKVMGGEDWEMWIKALKKAGVLAKGALTLAYSYIGPEMTFPIYREGTIGRAKEDLEAAAGRLRESMKDLEGAAYVSVNKALVTRASAVIPVVPLYISILFKIMKKKGNHEGCIEQMYRMLSEKIYKDGVQLDKKELIRLDDWEMLPEIQKEVAELWDSVDVDNLAQLSDMEGFRQDYLKLHGFNVEGVDYNKEVGTADID